jgi:hypothetical protein
MQRKKRLLKMQRKKRLFKWLYRIGLLFIAGAIIIPRIADENNELYFDIAFGFLFIGALLMIPDYWYFYAEKKANKEKFAGFWFSRFIVLPMVAILALVYFYVRFFRS